MRSLLLTLLAFALVTIGLPFRVAADQDCPEITALLLGKTFVAKKPLYDTKISRDGIIKLERDKQEIPQGAELRVLNVDCGGKKVEVTLRQEAAVKLDKVEIKFIFTAAERAMPNAEETFKTMMDYIFAKPADSEEP